MNTTKTTIALTVLFVTFAGAAVLAEDAPQPKKIEGQVVQVTQQTRTGSAGEFDAVTIRTREGKQMHLLLGQAGSNQGRLQVGDEVRARLSAGGSPGDGYRVRSMKVLGTGESFRYRNDSGELLQNRTQSRTRDRTRQPGSGCSGASGGGGHRGGGGGSRR